MGKYVSNYKANSKIKVSLTPEQWVTLTSKKGWKAGLKKLIGQERGVRLRQIDDAYRDWYKNPNEFRPTFRLNVRLNEYIKAHGGIQKVDRNNDLFNEVERLTRYAYLRLDQPETLEAAMASEDIQAATDQYYYDCIAWPNARKDIVMLFANLNVTPNYGKELTKFLTIGVSAAVATGTRNGGDFLSKSKSPDTYAKVSGIVTEKAQSLGLTNAIASKLMSKPKQTADIKQLAKDCDLTATETEVVNLDGLVDGTVQLDTTEDANIPTPPEIASDTKKSSVWSDIVAWIKKKFTELIEWLKPKIKKQFSSLAGWMEVIFGVANLIVGIVAKNAAPLVSAGLELTAGTVQAVERMVTRFQMKVLARAALPLSASMSELVQSFRSQAAADAAMSGLSAVLAGVKIAAEVMTAGATIFVNMIIEAMKWFISVVFKVLEARKVKAFLAQMRELWSYDTAMGRKVGGDTAAGVAIMPAELGTEGLNIAELKDDDTKGFVAAGYKETLVVADEKFAFKRLLVTACQTSILFPAIIMMSGILETHGQGVMFQYTYDSDPAKANAEGSKEHQLVAMMKNEARSYLTKRGFDVTPGMQDPGDPQEKERLEMYTEELFKNMAATQKFVG